ncbi:MAG: transcription-repair coupling factor [Ichthyobacteriaceae bacterium]|nr:transcription-repair coupling factor [Ichthyobacteriaceae bacterium]
MTPKELITLYKNSPLTEKISKEIEKDDKLKVCFSGLIGSLKSFYTTALYRKTENPFLVILDDKEQAAYFLNEAEQIVGQKDVLFYPGSYRRPYQIEETDNANVLLRAEVLDRINSRKKPSLIITYPDALFEKVITRKNLNKNSLNINLGDNLSIDFLNEILFEYKFNRVDFVTQPGDFSVRGGIVDIFSFSNDNPYRVEFFGDEIDSIRTFDIETQLSVNKITKFRVIPNIENKFTTEKRESFISYVSNKTVIIINNADLVGKRLDNLFEKADKSFTDLKEGIKHFTPRNLFINSNDFYKQIIDFRVIEFSSQPLFKTDLFVKTNNLPQPSFNKNFELLTKNLAENSHSGMTNLLFCGNDKQVSRFSEIFEDIGHNVKYTAKVFSVHEGFVDIDNNLAVYTDHQIFERYHKFNLKNNNAKKQSIDIKELTALAIGDFVTHIDHGIGKFGGLQKIEVEGKFQEAIKLIYSENDILYVSIHSLHKISKFNGKDGKTPKINKLGSPAWKALKNKTKKKVKEIAFDLIKLYAKRRAQKGYQFSPDSYLQHELEASFIYEDTPDQFTATQDVKQDMENARPMDRLVCGDVGFGKTEVAIRAAFKAATDGKQVAILVPTTILAFQHYQTFTERLKEMPVKINYLNRFRSAKQKREILADLENGKIDIIIGTHQLVSDKVKYKDLGLLIIDEEQKFGVAVKDKLKTLRANVDTLTLTATPIPRTLQFSLMAARDMSVINTPPPNRHPIDTQVILFNEETIRDAIAYEIARGGQVFYIHNRIENIKEVAGMIQRLVPDAKVAIGHGRMDGKELEKLTLDFIEGAFDVLVSTTIVESGIDVPNANTMIINNAQRFGLSDLHQMRGRVGRSNKKAFCYFIAPPYSALTDEARKRLQALEEYSGLGQGLNIAMKDLEIRGAGDILGGEQSGFMSDIGFETYQQILGEAINELKETEFKELFAEENKSGEKSFVNECQIDTDFEILLPDDYVNNISERLALYNKLNEIKDEKRLKVYQENLEDRFGKVPSQTLDLLNSMRIKWLAKELGFERVIMKRFMLIAYFIANAESTYYQSPTFTKLLDYAKLNPKNCTLKEKVNKEGKPLLTLVFNNVENIDNALNIFKDIEGFNG